MTLATSRGREHPKKSYTFLDERPVLKVGNHSGTQDGQIDRAHYVLLGDDVLFVLEACFIDNGKDVKLT